MAMESLLFDKEILFHLPDVYAVNAMPVDGGMIVMAGSETRHLPRVMSYPLLNKEEIVNCLGGMMSINPVADDGSKLVSVMGLFPGFNGLDGGIYSHVRDNGAWNTRLLFPLPFAHRCDVLNRDGRRYVFMASVSKHKANPDDWSMPGETYCGVYDESTGSLDDITCIDASLTRNHGMLKYELPGSGRECIYVSGREGIYEYDVVSGTIESRRIFDGEVSEFAFVDINGDGNVELVTIEPFHGNRLNVYRQEGDGGWMQIFSHPLVFGHGLSAGTLDGKPLIAVGNRRGDASLIVFGYDKESESIEKVYEEPGTGTTQSLFVVCNGVSGILCANQAKQEVVIYKLIKNEQYSK